MAGIVEKLEEEFAASVGAEGAVAAGFGRSALLLALEALRVRGGDVLVPDFVCAQVPEAVRHAGGRPVFCPVRRDLTVNPADFESVFTQETRAAIAVHYFGRLLPGVARLAAICGERDVPLVEDRALALGATLDGDHAGAFGLVSIFSLTKHDWCYGGGLVTSNSREMLARLRALREAKFRACRRLLFRYGLLRRADFAANRPTLSRIAERAGRWLERVSGPGVGNFYDAGRFDAVLPEFAARRARRVLASMPATTARRHETLRQLTKAFSDMGNILFCPQVDAGSAASFLLLACTGRAQEWIEEASAEGVTLRRCWPAYQAIEGLRASLDLRWLAEHLLVLEIHPWLAAGEIEQIARTLRRLAREESAGLTRNLREKLSGGVGAD